MLQIQRERDVKMVYYIYVVPVLTEHATKG